MSAAWKEWLRIPVEMLFIKSIDVFSRVIKSAGREMTIRENCSKDRHSYTEDEVSLLKSNASLMVACQKLISSPPQKIPVAGYPVL